MSDNIIQLNEDLIKHDLKDLVRSSVEETLNALLDKEADELVNAQKYERPLNGKVIVPAIIKGIFRLLPEKLNSKSQSSKEYLLKQPSLNVTAAENLLWKKL